MIIAPRLVSELVVAAQEAAPFECCGLIGGRDGEAVTVYPAANVAENPTMAYELDGAEHYAIAMEMDDAGLELAAIYHSHPRSPAFPSQADIALAFYPQVVYVIIGLADAEPDVRGWRIHDDRVTEAILYAAPLHQR
jgi:proteasome lid subunit RPN8/RPN11